MSESGRQAMKKVKGANLEDGYLGEKHFRKKKKQKTVTLKALSGRVMVCSNTAKCVVQMVWRKERAEWMLSGG